MHGKRTIFAVALVCLGLLAARSSGAGRYFRVERKSGTWWFVSPSGQLVLSAGVDHVSYRPDAIYGTSIVPYFDRVSKIYPTKQAWATAEIARLRSWGFNTLGSWSDASLWRLQMPYTVILDIAARSGANWVKGIPLDVYSPRFQATARQIAEKWCAPRAHDPDLLGYFSDNELRWGPDWRGKQNMLTMYLRLPVHSPGRQQAVEFLRKKYGDRILRLDRAWRIHATRFAAAPSVAGTEAFRQDSAVFLGMVARRYFQVCARAIHAADPNHLYLGAKFAGLPPDPVLRAASAADVVSVDIYRLDPRPLVEHIYRLSHRPVLVAEFAFRAEDSGLPNTRGAGPLVPNQAARALAYRNFVTRLEAFPEAVGYAWFEWCDEPREGRFDGENSNYGLVNVEDKPYQAFVTGLEAANQAALAVHRKLMN